jgi:tetratricopeptide (TPR) repeat protein
VRNRATMVRSRRIRLIAGSGLLLVLAVLLPDQAVLFAGAAAGWALAVLFIFRSREHMDYQKAVQHMRRGEYQQAIRILDTLIDAEPDSSEYRSFRANLCLLEKDLSRAETDYQWVVARDPASPDGYIGLAEIAMQRGDYDQARQHASAALKRDTDGWAAAYNLGLIEDRRDNADAAIRHLETALANGLPDRYQPLARLWLARNYHRLGRDDVAKKQIALLRKETKGLREWQVIIESDQGAVLRVLLERDVKLAQQLIESDLTLEVFNR